jgi:RimJ/RimL family protein N-acetyltransferase
LAEFKIIDLIADKSFLLEYVRLRNKYKELLLTREVGIQETEEWMKNAEVEIVGLAQDGILIGSAVLYVSRDNEIAIFVGDRGKGNAGRLLEAIERRAGERGAGFVWAWVLTDNHPARNAFSKAGFREDGRSYKTYKGESFDGIIFKKFLKEP